MDPSPLGRDGFSGGQQVDVNLSFGYVYVTGDAGALGTITVAFPLEEIQW